MQQITPEQIAFITNFGPRRKALGLTLRQVEEQTKVNYATLHYMEKGKIADPGFYTIVTLHNFYCSLESDTSFISAVRKNKKTPQTEK